MENTIQEIATNSIDWYHVFLFFAGVITASVVNFIFSRRLLPTKVTVCMSHPGDKK